MSVSAWLQDTRRRLGEDARAEDVPGPYSGTRVHVARQQDHLGRYARLFGMMEHGGGVQMRLEIEIPGCPSALVQLQDVRLYYDEAAASSA